jgi:MraZ protein
MESAAAREAARAFFGSSMDVQPDAQGRLVIPGFLLEDASITKEVRVIGRNHCLEIWDRQAWEGMQDRLRQTRLAVLDSIAANAQGQQGAVP